MSKSYALAIQKISDEMHSLPTTYHNGNEKAQAGIQILREANRLGAFDGSRYAQIRNELRRWESLQKTPLPEVVGQEETSDPDLITWNRIVQHTFPTLAENGNGSLALWCEWDEAALLFADLLEYPDRVNEPCDPDLLVAKQAPGTRPTSPRDAVLLAWYEAKGTETYHSYVNIVEKWNGLVREKWGAICAAAATKLNRQTAIKAVAAGKSDRGEKPKNNTKRRQKTKS